jgi:hypothetical protein
MPASAPEFSQEDTYESFKKAVQAQITNFDGCTFPNGRDFRFLALASHTVTLRQCTFAGKATLNFSEVQPGAAIIIGSPAKMSGRLVLLLSFAKLTAKNCYFSDVVEVASQVNGDIEADFQGSTFKRGVQVNKTMEGEWNFARTVFHGFFTFQPGHPHDQNPSSKKVNISFFRSRFTKAATQRRAEGLYRYWREWFTKIGDKDNEGFFYSLEKRSQRRGLPFGVTRAFSTCYDVLSSYGQSFVRPFVWFVLAQCIAAILYAWKSPNFEAWPAWDSTIPAFTLAQIARPFELFGLRANPELVISVIGNSFSPNWAIGTFVHSAISLFLFTLFILALRWRFKRT